MPRKLISTKQELLNNLQTFVSYSKSNLEAEREFFRESLSRGKCFVVDENGAHFAPSRFLGYVANNMPEHKRDEEKDGRITNNAINKILQSRPVQNNEIEQRFIQYCEENGVRLYKIKRKYWSL
ncbi:MAG TPA: hypothetical protein VNK96_03695 [Fimbriimonadales bacterium]|nr:hypothetical protein [Fimbriimonadales bacterium]